MHAHTFTDLAGRSWTIAITVQTLKDLRKQLGLDLMAADALPRLCEDPILLVDTLYVVCAEQAEKAGVSDSDFGRGLSGDVIEHATAAFVEALVDFFPRANQREAVRKGMALMRGAMDDAMRELIDKTDQVARSGFGKPSGSPTKPEASSGLIPETSPFESSSGCDAEHSKSDGTTPLSSPA